MAAAFLGALHASPAAASAAAWADPKSLGGCGVLGGPRVVFPSEGPSTATGPGAILWADDGRGCARPGPSSPASSPPGTSGALRLVALGPGDSARHASAFPLGGPPGSSPAGAAEALGGSLGRVTAAVPLRTGRADSGGTAVLQGRAGGSFGSPALFAGQAPPLALTRAYLGDVAIATVVPGPAIAVRVERYLSSSFGRARLIRIPHGAVTALTATMDYRSDVLVAWQQNGAIYAHMLRVSARPDPTQRVGPSALRPQLRALVSDNDHGMIAWASTEGPVPSQARTRVYIDLSAGGVRFGAPRPLAGFADPQRVCAMLGCLGLVRLSTENVMLAWTDFEDGRYTVLGAPAVFAGTRPATRLSGADTQAVLAGLAAGPVGDAVAVWESVPGAGGPFGGRLTGLWAARASLRRDDSLSTGPPEMVAPAGPIAAPSVAVDPASDRTVVAWLTMRGPASVSYAVGLAGGRHQPRPAVPAARAPAAARDGPGAALAAGVGALALAFLCLAVWRRRRVRRA